jgi:hypothetical protein
MKGLTNEIEATREIVPNKQYDVWYVFYFLTNCCSLIVFKPLVYIL